MTATKEVRSMEEFNEVSSGEKITVVDKHGNRSGGKCVGRGQIVYRSPLRRKHLKLESYTAVGGNLCLRSSETFDIRDPEYACLMGRRKERK